MNLLDLGVQLIFFLQGLGDWLIQPMKFLSFMGTENFYLVIMPFLYWSVEVALGLRIGMLLLLSASTNGIFKLLLHGPRPYWYDPQVHAYAGETSFGIPSGHAQNAVSVWVGFGSSLRKNWAWIASILLAFLIGLSRLYLGVHFPTDVLLGWFLGALLVWAFTAFEKPVLGWIKPRRLWEQILVMLGISLGLILLGVLARLSLGAWTIPIEWVQNAAITLPGEAPLAPLDLSGIISTSAAFFGLTAGAFWLATLGGYDSHGTWTLRFGRFALGLVGVLLIWKGLDLVFPDGENLLAYIFRFIRYGLTGFWISALAPLMFIRLKLAKGK